MWLQQCAKIQEYASRSISDADTDEYDKIFSVFHICLRQGPNPSRKLVGHAHDPGRRKHAMKNGGITCSVLKYECMTLDGKPIELRMQADGEGEEKGEQTAQESEPKEADQWPAGRRHGRSWRTRSHPKTWQGGFPTAPAVCQTLAASKATC